VSDRDLEHAAERFADTVHEAVVLRVREAMALEHDRYNAELAELRAWQHDHDKYAGGSHDAVSLRDELHAEIAELRDELHAEIAELRAELHATTTKLATLIEGMHAEIAELRDELHATTTKLATLIEGMHARGYVLDYSRLHSVKVEP